MTRQTASTGGRTSRSRRACLRVEELESRLVPSSVTGNAWPNPQLITLSFEPDGTVLGSNGTSYLYSNLFSAWTRLGSVSRWQNEVLRAAQTWAAQTNINFTVVSDDGSGIGTGPDQQGDPNKGDIRIGGYSFGDNWLAQAEMPPPVNDYSVAGDVQFNTGQAFNLGTTYDLYTVALHEIGHSLGLGESSVSSAAMYGIYTGVKYGLSSDDISGIRAIYSAGAPRSDDAYAGNNSFATAGNLTSLIDPTALTALVNNLQIATTSEQDYYTFTAPANTSGTLVVKVQSKGLSLLSPKAWVYASDQSTVLGYAYGTNQDGTALTITVNNVTAGQQLYVKVSGADCSVFSTGTYALTLNFGTGLSPTVTPPNTTVANGSPLQGGGGMPQEASSDGDTPGHDAFSGQDADAAAAAANAGTPAAAAAVPTSTNVAAPAVAAAPSTAAGRPVVHAVPAVVPEGPATPARVLPAAPAPAAAAPAGANLTINPAVPAVPATSSAAASGGDTAMDPGTDQAPTAAAPTADPATPAQPGTDSQPATPGTLPDRLTAARPSLSVVAPPDAVAMPEAPQDAVRGNPLSAAAVMAFLLAWNAEPQQRQESRRRAG
jgi:hypothetical protein